MKIASRSRLRVPEFLLLLMALCLGAGSVAAAGIDVTKIPKPSVLTSVPQEVFEKDTKEVIENKPYGDEQLSYSIRIPKNWVGDASGPDMVSGGVGVDVLDVLARYVSAPKNLVRSHITVEAQQLSYEISAQNWFVNFILGSGFSLISMIEKSPHEVEATYVQVEKDQTYVVRVRVLINGSKLIMVKYYLPQENYQEERPMQAQILAGFKLLKLSNERVEQQKVYGFLDQSYFNYPESWILRENEELTIERMEVMLFQARKDGGASILDGQIKVAVISRLLDTTLKQEIVTFRKDFKLDGYKIGKLVESKGYRHDVSIKTSKTEFYKLVPDDPVNRKEYELAVSVLVGEDYYYIISLVTPSRDENFYSWARNMEVFKIVSETARRYEK